MRSRNAKRPVNIKDSYATCQRNLASGSNRIRRSLKSISFGPEHIGGQPLVPSVQSPSQSGADVIAMSDDHDADQPASDVLPRSGRRVTPGAFAAVASTLISTLLHPRDEITLNQRLVSSMSPRNGVRNGAPPFRLSDSVKSVLELTYQRQIRSV